MRSNEAAEGGAIYSVDSALDQIRTLIESDVRIVNNTASGNGGGLSLVRGDELRCTGDVRFEGNRAGGDGGSIYAIDIHQFTTDETTFLDNTATSGGAIFAAVRRSFTVASS